MRGKHITDDLETENTKFKINYTDNENNNTFALQCEQQSRRVFPTRYVIGFMLFLVSMSSYIVRSSFSLSLLAMVNVYDENGTLIQQPDNGPRYDWNGYEQGLLLGAFYYAYIITIIPIGLLLDRYTIGKQFIFVAFAACAAMLVLSPVAASSGSFGWLFVMRLVIGATQGGTYPNVHRMIARWAPPAELGAFVVSLIGYPVGTILSWIVAGPVIDAWGWQWSFYVDAAMIAAFAALWAYNVYDSPARHPRITEAEREFIETSKPAAAAAEAWPPLRDILSSAPFWALLLLTFSNDWFWYFLMTGVPMFMYQVLGFTIGSTGLLASVPYVASILGSIWFGFAGDYLRRRKIMSVIAIRKSFLLFSHILPSMLMLGIAFVPADQPYLCVVLMTLAFGFNGAAVQTTLSNGHDLGPDSAASTMAIVDCVSATNGFISPLVVAYFTRERSTVLEWRYIFICGVAVNTLGMLAFMCLGSATDQKWTEKRLARANRKFKNGSHL